MTVSELIERLKKLPPDAPVSVNDEVGGTFHEDVETVFHVPAYPEEGDRACVILVVNPDPA